MKKFVLRPGSRAFVLSAGAAIACLALTACGGDADTPDELPEGVSTVGTATTEPIDSLNWGLPYGEPNTIDPPNTAYYSSAFVASNLCDPLLRLNPDYSISPNLATAKQVDPTTVVFTLREDVTFWNGDPMTAADVVWSLKHAFSPEAVAGFLFTSVKSVKETGPAEVTVEFKAPDALFLKEIASFAGMVQQASFAESVGEKLGSAQGGIMCTGAYKLDKWEPGTRISLSANPNYWNSKDMARAKKVDITFVTDSNSLAQALSSGQLDGAYEVPASAIPKLQKSGAGRLVFGSPTQEYVGLLPVQSDGVLSDINVRKALWMTIDRKAIADVVYHGAAEPNYTVVNVDAWRNGDTPKSAQELWQEAYAPFEEERSTWGSSEAVADAKKLLESTDYDGAPVVIGVPAGDATVSQLAQLIQAQAKAVGFDVKIESLQPIQYSNALVHAKDRVGIDMLVTTNFNVAPAPLESIIALYLPDSPYNHTNYDDATVTKSVETARQTLDPIQRAKLMVKAQAVYEKDYGVQTLVQLREIMYLKKGLAGATSSFAYLNEPSLALIGKSAR